jgi:hypothetical protein
LQKINDLAEYGEELKELEKEYKHSKSPEGRL